ncbi:hypothetical protein N8667_07815 [Verrucomicrobia bacterium]|nr:hypothetical protein [Verrucomicrobiota bacterium]
MSPKPKAPKEGAGMVSLYLTKTTKLTRLNGGVHITWENPVRLHPMDRYMHVDPINTRIERLDGQR